MAARPGRLLPLRKGNAMKVRVHVSLKPGVLDPQGRAIQHALEGLGFDVILGRLIPPTVRVA